MQAVDLEQLGEGNYVVKADGLCGGKGVMVAGDHLSSIEEALAYCKECLPHFVLCEKLRGEEFSVLSFSDGQSLKHMPAVQDHKRAYEGDSGPNTGAVHPSGRLRRGHRHVARHTPHRTLLSAHSTGGTSTYTCEDHLLPFLSAGPNPHPGYQRQPPDTPNPNPGGMGTYTCEDHLLPFLSEEVMQEARAINAACVRALRAEIGELYKGILYGGYMLTPKGVMLIEFNCRFGDPEYMHTRTHMHPCVPAPIYVMRIESHCCFGGLTLLRAPDVVTPIPDPNPNPGLLTPNS